MYESPKPLTGRELLLADTAKQKVDTLAQTAELKKVLLGRDNLVTRQPEDVLAAHGSLEAYEEVEGRASNEVRAYFIDKESKDAVRRYDVLRDEQRERESKALASDAELDTKTGQAKQMGAAAVVGSARLAGDIASLPATAWADAALEGVSDEDRELYAIDQAYKNQISGINKERVGIQAKLALGQLDAESASIANAQLDAREASLVAPDTQRLDRKPESFDRNTTGSDQMLGASGFRKGAPSLTPRQSIDQAKKALDFALKTDKAISSNKMLDGLMNPLNRDAFDKDLSKSWDKHASSFTEVGEAWEKGDTSGAVSKLAVSVAGLAADGLGDVINNPAATFEYIAENAPQLLVGAAGKAGQAVLTTSNIGYGADIYREALQDYQVKNDGALPSKEDATKMLAISLSAAAAEQVMDVSILKSIKGSSAVNALSDKVTRQVSKNILTRGLKGAGRVAGAVTTGVTGEALTEGYQTAVEDAFSKLSTDVDGENLFKAAVIGGASGGALKGGVTAAKEAVSGVQAVAQELEGAVKKGSSDPLATAGQKAFDSAVKTGKVDALTDPESVAYAPNEAVRALQERTKAPDTDAATVLKEQAKAKKVLDDAKERLSAMKAGAANSNPEGQIKVKALLEKAEAELEVADTPEKQAAATSKIELLSSLVRTPKQAKEEADKLAQMTETVSQTELYYNDWVNTENKSGSLKSTIDLADSDKPEAAAAINELVEVATNNPSAITEEVANRLASNNLNSLTEPQRAMFRNLARMSRVKREYRDTDEVTFDVLRDDPNTGNIGMEAYQRNINKAISKGDKASAEASLYGLTQFAQAQNAKRKAILTAMKTGTVNAPVYLIPKGKGVWEQTSERPTQEVMDEKNVIEVTEKTFKLAGRVAKEAELLNTAVQAAKATIQVKFDTPVEKTKRAKDEVKAQPEPKSESKAEASTAAGTNKIREELVKKFSSKTSSEIRKEIANRKKQQAKAPIKKIADLKQQDIDALEALAVEVEAKEKPADPVKATKEQVSKFQAVAKRLGEAQAKGTSSTALRVELNKQLDTLDFGFSEEVKDLYRTFINADGLVPVSVVQKWVNNNGNKGMSSLLDKLLESDSAKKLKGFNTHTLNAQEAGDTYKPLGMYFEGTNTVGIDFSQLAPFNSRSQTNLVNILVHEVVHAVTESSIQNDPKLVQEIRDIQSAIKEWLKDNAETLTGPQLKGIQYALKNESELLTMGLTDPSTIKALNLIPFGNGQTVLGKFTQSILDFFRRSLRMAAKETTALEEVLRISERFLDGSIVDLSFEADVVAAETTFTQESETYLPRTESHLGKKEGVLSLFDQSVPEEINNSNYQTTNLIAAFFKQSAEKFGASTPRPLVAIKDFMSALMNGDVRAQDFLEDGLTPAQGAFIEYLMNDFSNWKDKLQSLLVLDADGRQAYRYENPIQFFMTKDPETGAVVMDENVMSAVIVSAWTWLADNASSPEIRTDEEINRSLAGRDKDALVKEELRDLMGPLLNTRSLVVDSLGQGFVNALGLKAKGEQTPMNEKSRLEANSGLLVYSLLEAMGVIEDVEVSKAQLLTAMEVPGAADVKGVQNFVKLVATGTGMDRVLDPRTADFKELSKGTAGLLDNMFGVEMSNPMPTLKAKKIDQVDTNRGKQGIPKFVSESLQNIGNLSYTFRKEMVGLVREVDSFAKSLIGIEEVDTSKVHKVNRKGKQATADGKTRELENALGFLSHLSSVSEEGENAGFFVSPELWKNHRFGYMGTTLNMQSSKIHRFLAKQGEWLSVVGLNPDVESDTSLSDFKMRVLEGLGVKTDAEPDAVHLAKFDDTLAATAYAEAIEVLRNVLYTPDYTLSDMDKNVIVDGVKKGGENLHSLDSLVAMAHYQQAVAVGADSFTTELTAEIDGKTNGPMLSLWLLGGMTPVLAQMGGFFSQNSGFTHYSGYKPGRHDLYQHVAKGISDAMVSMSSVNPEELQPVFASLYNITGELVDTLGGVTKAGRDLVKNPLTTLVYGSGMGSTISGMADGFIDSIYTHIEKINQGKEYGVNRLTGKDAFDQLSDDLNLLMGAAWIKRDAESGELIIPPYNKRSPKKPWTVGGVKQAMEVSLTKEQEAQLRRTFELMIGSPTKSVIETKFADYMEARNTVTVSSNLTFALYEGVKEENRARAINLLMDAGQIAHSVNKQGKKTPRHDLNPKQEKQVLSVIKALEPRMHTALSKQGDELGAGIYIGKQKRTSKEGNGLYDVRLTLADKKRTGNGFGVVSEAPGVSVLANSVQSTDAGIMVSVTGAMNALGIHDAIMVAVKDAAEAGKAINAKTFELLVNYSIPRESLDALERTLKWTARNIKADPNNTKLVESVRNQILAAFEKMNEVEFASLSEKGLIQTVLKNAREQAKKSDVARLTQLAQLEWIDQYTIQSGAAEITDAMRQMAKDQLSKILAEGFDPEIEQLAKYLDARWEALDTTNSTASPSIDLDVQGEQFADVDASDESQVNLEMLGDLASPNAVNNFSVQDVFEALGQNPDRVTDPALISRLRDVIDNVVTRLHGPYQTIYNTAKRDALNVPDDVYRNAAALGALPFQVDVRSAGFRMGDQQAFTAEMVQMVVGESLAMSVNQVEKELSKLFEEARNNVAKTAFDADPVVSERMWNYVFNIAPGDLSTSHLSRFAALGLTDSKLGDLLGFATTKAEDVSPTTIYGKLMQWFYKLLQVLNEGLGKAYGGQQADQKLKVIVDRLVDLQVSREAETAPSKLKEFKERLEDAMDGVSESVREKVVNATNTDFFKKSKNPLLRFTGDLVNKAADNRLEEIVIGLEDFYNRSTKGRLGELAELFNEVRGTNDLNKWGRIKLLMAKHQEKTRKELAVNVAKVAMDSFKDGGVEVTQRMREAVTSVLLRTDVAGLMDKYSLSDVQDFLSNTAKLNAEIQALRNSLGGRYKNYYANQAKLTGHYLATERAVGDNLRMNALSIALLDGTRYQNQLTEADVGEILPTIDALITLEALSYTSEASRTEVANLMAIEASRTDGGNGVELSLKLHKKLTQDSKERLFQGSERLMVKGYLPEITSPYIETTSVASSEVAAMKKAGWVDHGSLKRDKTNPDGTTYHLMTLDRGLMQRVSGTISTTSLKAMGTSARYTGPHYVQRIERSKRASVDSLFKSTPMIDPTLDSNAYLVPTSNADGHTVDFRSVMKKETRDELLERNNNFDLLLGTLASNIYDKESSDTRNKEIVDLMYEQWNKHKSHDAHAYLLVGPNSADPEVREAYALIPYSTRKHIESVWGDEGMMVRRDMFNLHFGFRKYSMAEMFDKTPADRNALENILVPLVQDWFGLGEKAGLRVRQAGDVWEAAVREVKDFLVVKTGATLFWNVVSNLSLLYLYGVNPVEMARSHRIAFKGVMDWEKDSAELAQLEAMKEAGYTGNVRDLDHQIAKLKIALNRNPVRKLIEAGLKPSIVEDVSVEEDLFSYQSTLGKKADALADKVPDSVKTVAKWIYVAHDTPLYKVLNQGTQMSDFVARYTLYEKLTTQRKEPLSHEEAVAFVSDAFVNYDIPSGKGMQYANDIGAVMFTKYYLRIQRVIQHAYRNHPSRALLLTLFDSYFTGMQTIADSSFFSGFGINVSTGALELPEAFGEGIPADMIGKLFH